MHAGEKRLLHGDASGIELFGAAADLDPHNLQMLHRQGLAIFDYACQEHPKSLLAANQKFKRAVKLDPNFFEGWLSWGNTLFLLGNATKEHHYFIDAKEKFEKALDLSRGKSNEMLLDLYWNYGLAVNQVALKSGDPLDLHLACQAFHKASLNGDDLPSNFWCDFARVCMRLFAILGDLSYLNQAIEHFKTACGITVTDHQCWTYLGDALTQLFLITHEEENFEQANECYSAAATMKDEDPAIWLKWATLLLQAGRLCQDGKMLHSALEKCHKAKSLGAERIELTCTYAETLSELGTLKNRLKNLRKAESIMQELSDIHPKNAQVRTSNGIVILALADYFDCLDSYFLAIEEFQSALSIDRSLHTVWHAMGLAYLSLSDLEDDPDLQLSRAIKFFKKAIAIEDCPTYHFDLACSYLKLAEDHQKSEDLKCAISHFEYAIGSQKNAFYLYPDWLFSYVCALNLSGDLNDSYAHLEKALDLLHHIQALAPDHPDLHHRFALCYGSLAELSSTYDLFATASHHYRIAHRHDADNDDLLIDWAMNLMSWSENTSAPEIYLHEAERKLISAIKLGNASAYYTLAGLCASQGQGDRALLYLKRAHKFDALPTIDELIDDHWLENLHDTPDFQSFVVTVQQASTES